MARSGAVDAWLSELFAPDDRQSVAETIVGIDEPSTDREGRASRELAEIERRIDRLLDAVESGSVDSADLRDRLKRLRHRRDAVRSEMQSEHPPEALTATEVLRVLDEFGGLMIAMDALTREHREAIYRAASLTITYHPVEREVDLAVSLAAGGGATERVGGGTRYKISAPRVTVTSTFVSRSVCGRSPLLRSSGIRYGSRLVLGKGAQRDQLADHSRNGRSN